MAMQRRRKIPTVYRGPRTFSGGIELVCDGESPEDVVRMMWDAGYKGAAAKLRSELAKEAKESGSANGDPDGGMI
jgi:hypothetical protein